MLGFEWFVWVRVEGFLYVMCEILFLKEGRVYFNFKRFLLLLGFNLKEFEIEI